MKIRITRTEIWEYEPDVTEDFYLGCKTIEEAMERDKKFYEDKRGGFDEITTTEPYISTVWEITDN